ncbi:YitT family protein [Aerococcus kribbianus]|uniref:YitT family protein n=1 Tax=Aerococcus kribbianus TaxID=2999064 RepID=A0A9X3FMH4_9LACT|nr:MULTISPECIES: YitT family protein [unclassified Aerococcus]MCZ0717267.1 YitT family protein [Aerococcus sp. YH-aer221]MCZ0725555.1 YitT family protein [Aerococcus sp. YH-aer222]
MEAIKRLNLTQLLMVALGTFLMTIGLYFFLVPDELVGGGTAGITIVLDHFIGLPYSLILLIVNLFLLSLGIIFVGKDFGGTTIVSIVLYSFFYGLFERFMPLNGPVADDSIVNLILGVVIMAVGLGTVYNAGASTGGTDILGKIINMHTPIPFALSVMIVDLTVLMFVMLIFGVDRGLYASIGILLNSQIVDKIMSGGNVKFQVTIISEHGGTINDFILTELHRATTIYNAKGGYTKAPRAVIITVINRSDMIELKRHLHEVDMRAFLYVSTVSEVTGEGFTYNIKPTQHFKRPKKKAVESKHGTQEQL